jgi:hypothetical protein
MKTNELDKAPLSYLYACLDCYKSVLKGYKIAKNNGKNIFTYDELSCATQEMIIKKKRN